MNTGLPMFRVFNAFRKLLRDRWCLVADNIQVMNLRFLMFGVVALFKPCMFKLCYPYQTRLHILNYFKNDYIVLKVRLCRSFQVTSRTINTLRPTQYERSMRMLTPHTMSYMVVKCYISHFGSLLVTFGHFWSFRSFHELFLGCSQQYNAVLGFRV